jgi:isoleucyl-tRNA synthetase
LKDRLYTAAPQSLRRRSAQTAIFKICEALCRLMAPILCFTADEVWKCIAGYGKRKASIHLEEFPDPLELPEDQQLLGRWNKLIEVRDAVSKALEISRQGKIIGNSLEAKVRIEAPEELLRLLQSFGEELRYVFIASQVEFGATGENRYCSETIKGLSVEVSKADGTKCERCWNYTTDVGKDPRYPQVCGRCVQAMEAVRP